MNEEVNKNNFIEVNDQLETGENEVKKHKSLLRRAIDFLLVPFIASVITWVVVNLVIIIMVVPTGSMEPLIKTQSLCFGSRLAYTFSEPQRGDIVVFEHVESGKLMVKRLIGLPGDEITLEGHVLTLNGVEQREHYVQEVPDYDEASFTVPEGEYFFLGDNRNGSLDARYWKDHYISRENIVAKYWTGFYIGG